MPSTIGHAVSGVVVAWTADLISGGHTGPPPQRDSWYRRTGDGLAITCAVIAAVPDVDLLFHAHRTYTHSIGAVAITAAIAAVAAAVRGLPVMRITSVCAAAYASHLLLDWLAADYRPPYGLQLFWPFSNAWLMSGWDLFRQTERRRFFSPTSIWINVKAVGQELLILLPIAAIVWSVRVKALARLSTQVPRGDHAAQ